MSSYKEGRGKGGGYIPREDQFNALKKAGWKTAGSTVPPDVMSLLERVARILARTKASTLRQLFVGTVLQSYQTTTVRSLLEYWEEGRDDPRGDKRIATIAEIGKAAIEGYYERLRQASEREYQRRLAREQVEPDDLVESQRDGRESVQEMFDAMDSPLAEDEDPLVEVPD